MRSTLLSVVFWLVVAGPGLTQESTPKSPAADIFAKPTAPQGLVNFTATAPRQSVSADPTMAVRDIVPGIAKGIVSGVPSMAVRDDVPGIAKGIVSGVPSMAVRDNVPGIAKGIVSGVPSMAFRDIVPGIAKGIVSVDPSIAVRDNVPDIAKGIVSVDPSIAVRDNLPAIAQETTPESPDVEVFAPSAAPQGLFFVTRTAPRLSVSADYLVWQLSHSPVSVPLVSTGDFTKTTGGFIGDPSTTVLFGNSSYDMGAYSGGRVGLVWWLDDNQVLGIDGGGFWMQSRSRDFRNATNPVTGGPLILLPYQDTAGVEQVIVIANPAIPARGNVRVTLENRLWGAHVNGVVNLKQTLDRSVDFLLGFRYYDFSESLEIATNRECASLRHSSIERFRTRNQFYGGQFGGRAGVERFGLSAEFTGLVALGQTQQLISAVGTSNFAGAGVADPGFRSGFVYTQLSNIGSAHHNAFSVVPQLQAKLGYDLTCRLRATLAYDVLYWNNIVRPGQQIDRTINFTQGAPIFGGLPGGLVGPARPAPQHYATDFWAHGISVGLELRW